MPEINYTVIFRMVLKVRVSGNFTWVENLNIECIFGQIFACWLVGKHQELLVLLVIKIISTLRD